MNKFKIHSLKQPIKTSVRMPGSKSYTNRALIMAALADGKSVITGISESDDSKAMIEALRKFGLKIEVNGDSVAIFGNGGKFKEVNATINIGAAGTTMRFLTSLCCLIPGKIVLDGSERMRERPIRDLIDALKLLGAQIEYLGKDGCPPIKIIGGNLSGSKVRMNGSFSSQYFTSLLLIAPLLKNGLEIEVIGEQISKSYIDMTIDGLRAFGVEVENEDYKKYIVKAESGYKPTNYHVEGDCSGAAYLWGIAAITGSSIRVENINPKSAQGDVQFPKLLEKMGCKVNYEDNSIEVIGAEELKSIIGDIDMEQMPDTAQPLSIVLAQIPAKSKMIGLSTLKIKETDRILAMHNELKKCGINTEFSDDSLTIIGGSRMSGAEIETYKDHRMAMSFAMAGTKVENMIIHEPEVVSKSFPEFWDILSELGLEIERLD
jgi:3-phosphoshikimate 1-carboxyvinyltransferase